MVVSDSSLSSEDPEIFSDNSFTLASVEDNVVILNVGNDIECDLSVDGWYGKGAGSSSARDGDGSNALRCSVANVRDFNGRVAAI